MGWLFWKKREPEISSLIRSLYIRFIEGEEELFKLLRLARKYPGIFVDLRHKPMDVFERLDHERGFRNIELQFIVPLRGDYLRIIEILNSDPEIIKNLDPEIRDLFLVIESRFRDLVPIRLVFGVSSNKSSIKIKRI